MISGIDFDLDIDVDFDVDADANSNVNIEGNSLEFEDVSNAEVDKEHVRNKRNPLKWWQIILVYFNFVELPFMFTFSFWIFVWWCLTIFATTLTLSYDNVFGHYIFIGGLIPALIINKILTSPFKSFFKRIKKDGDTPIDLIGRTGVILSTISGDKMGSAEVVARATPMSIYVKSIDGTEIRYKDKILIIKKAVGKEYYYAQLYEEN